MKQKRLDLYTVSMKYIRNLTHADDHVYSVSPQTGKDIRPFLGVIIICDDRKYCVPLSSPKKKHASMKNDVDFSKVFDEDGKLIGVLNFNNMIPVRDDVITRMDLRIHKNDSISVKQYKVLAGKQIEFCRKNQDAIIRKANKLYKTITVGTPSGLLKKRCCKFKILEGVLDRFNQK